MTRYVNRQRNDITKDAANKMTLTIDPDTENEAIGVLRDSELKRGRSNKMANRVGPNKSNVDKIVSKEVIEALDFKSHSPISLSWYTARYIHLSKNATNKY